MDDTSSALPGGYALHEYRIESLLGAGGFGLTYLATDSNLNLKVAVKEYLPRDIASRGEDSTVQPRSASTAESYRWGLERFMTEARTLATFRHPSIVRVMRFFEANATGYMVMEFVEGTSLPEWVRVRRPVPQDELLRIAGPLLDGLEVIHKGSYLHRDVKPANIYIRGDGSPVLLDFGSARRVAGGDQELTAVISPGYAPFEQYHAHGNQGPWSDLYALGGVMYWIVTGAKPLEAAARVKKDVMPSAAQAEHAARYSAEFLAAIDWALKPNEEERPQSVAEFKARLLGAQARSSDRTVAHGGPAAAAPAPAARAETGMTGLTGVALDRAQVKRVETELARHIGPIATVVVRNAAKTAPSIAALAQAVSREIAEEKERAALVRRFAAGDAATHPPGAPAQAPPAAERSISEKFPAPMLQAAETALAQYIGAIAKVVVRRAAGKARDEAELYLLIADEIKDPAERKNFVRRAVSAARPR